MKKLMTKKAIKERYNTILKIPYCSLQGLLFYLEPKYYSTRIEGWACDYYDIDGICISTGYSPIGQEIDYNVINKYNNKAVEINNQYNDYEIRKQKITILLDQFIKEVTI